MAAKVDLHSGQGPRSSMSTGSGSGGQKQKMGDKNKGKGQVGMVEQGNSSEDANLCFGGKEEIGRSVEERKSGEEVVPAIEKEPRQAAKDLCIMWEGGPFF